MIAVGVIFKSMLLHFSCWEMGYVRGVENKVAHVLAHLALNNNLDRVCQYDPPECIREILDVEQFALYFPI